MASIESSVSLQEIGIVNKSPQNILLQKGDRKSVPEENEDNCTQVLFSSSLRSVFLSSCSYRKSGQHSDLASFARKQETLSEDKTTSVTLSFALHLENIFRHTIRTVAILALSFILLFTWKYGKSLIQTFHRNIVNKQDNHICI